MGISKYNAEGYYDPTAYEGIRNACAVAPKVKMTYSSGCMAHRSDNTVTTFQSIRKQGDSVRQLQDIFNFSPQGGIADEDQA